MQEGGFPTRGRRIRILGSSNVRHGRTVLFAVVQLDLIWDWMCGYID